MPVALSIAEIRGFIHIKPNSGVISLKVEVHHHNLPKFITRRVEKIREVAGSRPNTSFESFPVDRRTAENVHFFA